MMWFNQKPGAPLPDYNKAAVSPKVRNAAPAMIRPQTYWNADRLALTPAQLARNTR
jgi:hypothetical protein